METRDGGGFTVREVEATSEPKLAMMAVVPCLALVASPCEPVEFEIVATVGTDEVQVTDVVRSAFDPFLKWPVAANCC